MFHTLKATAGEAPGRPQIHTCQRPEFTEPRWTLTAPASLLLPFWMSNLYLPHLDQEISLASHLTLWRQRAVRSKQNPKGSSPPEIAGGSRLQGETAKLESAYQLFM